MIMVVVEDCGGETNNGGDDGVTSQSETASGTILASTSYKDTGRLVLKNTVFSAWASKLNMGLINKG